MAETGTDAAEPIVEAPPSDVAPAPAVETAESVAKSQAEAVGDALQSERAELPNYTRSLLRIKVPVMVTLAAKHQQMGQILELVPGSIIHFDKSCDEELELEAAGHRVALGEAVKVGDKFGLRVTSLVLPGERFQPLRPPALS